MSDPGARIAGLPTRRPTCSAASGTCSTRCRGGRASEHDGDHARDGRGRCPAMRGPRGGCGWLAPAAVVASASSRGWSRAGAPSTDPEQFVFD